jgi:alpha-L-fucosidase
MAMFVEKPVRPAQYQRFERPTPAWFQESSFGIFVHWGAYSVPAWAEPIGELGTIESTYWFAHNPYAEWYYNTIRIDDSPAQQHHREVFGGAPYDDFLDQWKAESFDPADLTDLFRRAGARYVIPTTKHHDGITLWDAPGTGDRNTARRGPHRDLIGAFAAATRDAGMRFGVYYSSGLDWHAAPSPPIRDDERGFFMPNDAAYAEYAYKHVVDLIDRYAPDVLWGDIGYPDAGKPEGPFSLVNVLDRYYDAVPDGVVNDRWGLTHWDFRTSEYQQGTSIEGNGMWQNTRGIGYSFGYNQREDATHYLDAAGAVKQLLDVVSRGGTFLLNVGPDAAGRIPELQRRCLEGLAAWMAVNDAAVHAVAPLNPAIAGPGEDPWFRWTSRDGLAFLAIDAGSSLTVSCDVDALDLESAARLDGTPARVLAEPGGMSLQAPGSSIAGPVVIKFRLR